LYNTLLLLLLLLFQDVMYTNVKRQQIVFRNLKQEAISKTGSGQQWQRYVILKALLIFLNYIVLGCAILRNMWNKNMP